MVNTIVFLLIVLGIMFLIGIAMAILALYFNIKRKYPIVTIIFSIVLIPLICIPIQLTVGIWVSRCMLIIALIYSVAMIVMAVKNIRDNGWIVHSFVSCCWGIFSIRIDQVIIPDNDIFKKETQRILEGLFSWEVGLIGCYFIRR